MRAYAIRITNPTSGALWKPSALKSSPSTFSFDTQFYPPLGQPTPGAQNPGALDIEFDIPVNTFALPAGAGWLKVLGIAVSDVAQISNINNFNIAIYGGMAKGLPLANPTQYGLLAEGYIVQAFGNYVDLQQSVEMIFQAMRAPGSGSAKAPRNLTLNWTAGTPLGDAIRQTLTTGFPGYTCQVNISPDYVLPRDEPGFYGTIEQFAAYVQDISSSIVAGSGVHIAVQGNVLSVFDGTWNTSPIQIIYTDLIGQPTWLAPNVISAKTVLRSDIAVGSIIEFPKGTPVTTTPQSVFGGMPAPITFQGKFRAIGIRHIGNFRQPTGDAWVTVITANPL